MTRCTLFPYFPWMRQIQLTARRSSYIASPCHLTSEAHDITSLLRHAALIRQRCEPAWQLDFAGGNRHRFEDLS